MENIYPQDFFSLQHPLAPVVNIQFRTKITNEDIESSKNWESITFNPSTFFESINIEDQGGAQKITLNLFDKNYARLENIVVKSLLAARLANKLIEEPNYSKDGSGFFQFFISKVNSANLRIRFGYSESRGEESLIDEASTASEVWKNRVEDKKPVGRSPWLYFQMSGAKFRFQNSGLKIEIQGFSVTGSFLDKAKMIQKFARLRGSPKDILENIKEIVNEASTQSSGEEIVFEYEGGEPVGYPDSEGSTDIEIMLGSEASAPKYIPEEDDYRVTTLYKSLKQVLTEICSKVKPKIYDADGNIIEQPPDHSRDAQGTNEENEKIDKTAPYGYVIIEEKERTVIRFYYQDPNDQVKNQRYARTYIWNEDGHSIVKNFDFESKTDFATLNLPIATVDSDGGEMTLHVATGHSAQEEPDNEEEQDRTVDYTIGNLRDVSDALNSSDFNAMFVTNVRDTSSFQASNSKLNSRQSAAILSRRIVAALNNQIFSGALEIPGDAFYLFDGNIKPFSYLIKVIVRRPNYLNQDGEYVEGGTSYASGLYAIKKITHSISKSGFSTKLDIMKWPRK